MTLSIIGNNSYLMKRRLDEIAAEFVKKNGNLALERLDGAELELGKLLDAVQSLPMLADRKLIVVRDLSQNKAVAERIEQIISSIAETTDLIFYEPNIDRRSSYFKVLKSDTTLEEYKSAEAAGLARWLVDEAKNQGANLSLADANFLVQRVGEDQQLLSSELAKLATYNSAISRGNIELLVEESSQSRTFDLLDAAFSGNQKRALQVYDEQRAQNVEPQQILGMITWQLWLIALVIQGKERATRQIAADAGMNSAYPLDKARRLTDKISAARLNRLVERAYKLDKLSKARAVDLDEALKTYLSTI